MARLEKRRSESQGRPGQAKRQRVTYAAPTSEDVTSARQLMQLLATSQDMQKARHGLQSFKLVLDRLNDPETQTPEDAAIVRDYLGSPAAKKDVTRRRDTDGEDENETIYLPDIMDTWSLAAKQEDDGVMSAVPVVLALLLKYLSNILDLASTGLGICRTVLVQQQLDLIGKNLTADKAKEFIISPTLRLLREVISFDGGAVAKAVFRSRVFTYRSLARNMGLKYYGDGVEDRTRTSVRTNGVRFFLASLKYLHTEARTELLGHRDMVSQLTKNINDDPPYVICDILQTIQNYVIADKKLAKMTKLRLLNTATLIRIATLYDNTSSADTEEGGNASINQLSVADVAHKLLLTVCTSPAAGVLREQLGYYPVGADLARAASASDEGFARETVKGTGKSGTDLPVHNMVLAELMAVLRPLSSSKQRELLIATFAAAPELIAWYFARKNPSFQPFLSTSWIRFSTLLFDTIQIDVPAYFGASDGYARVPPPTSTIVDSILPLPLSQKTMIRCLTHQSKLIAFLATRLLALAMAKLQRTLQMHDAAARRHPYVTFWDESRERVLEEFGRRLPPVHDVFTVYRKISSDDLLYREASSRVLRLFFEVTPQVSSQATFDISPSILAALKQVGEDEGSTEERALHMMELENLLPVALSSPGMKWFSKEQGLAMSPFGTLLKVEAEVRGGLGLGSFGQVLDSVATVGELVRLDDNAETTTSSGVAALLQSLAPASADYTSLPSAVWDLVDSAVSRCFMHNTKYIEKTEELLDEDPTEEVVDPITLAIVEQLPHAVAKVDDKTAEGLADFLLRYIQCCKGGKGARKSVFKDIRSAFSKGSVASERLGKNIPKRAPAGPSRATPTEDVDMTDAPDEPSNSGVTLDALLDMAPVPELDNSALTKWVNKEVEEIVEDGHAASLIMLLASENISIRKEAIVNVRKMAVKVNSSNYSEKEQVWLLLMCLNGTVKAWDEDKAPEQLPLPSYLLSFACHALIVLRDPLHFLYPKVNKFLTSSPVWRFYSPPLGHIMDETSSEENKHYAELSWLLTYLLDGLRTPEDLDTYRNRKIFHDVEHLLCSPYLRRPLRHKALRILCRAMSIEGGSNTLITRTGLVTWLVMGDKNEAPTEEETQETGGTEGVSIAKALLEKLRVTCDEARLAKWSNDRLGQGADGVLQAAMARAK